MDVPAIVSAEAAWITDSALQVNVTFDDGSIQAVTVLVPPPPGLPPEPPWDAEEAFAVWGDESPFDPDYDTYVPPDFQG